MVKDNDILQAVRERNIDNLSKLLQKTKNGKKLLASSKKLNINYQDEEGMAAIHQAALQGNAACINLLINNGAQADIKDNKGMRPLHYAAWQGLMEPVTLLLQAGASPVEPSNNGETPIHFACQHGHVEVVLLLLKYKADPTVESHAYKTSLDLACEFGKYHVVDLLVKSNLCAGLLLDRSDLSADTKRSTPLHLAARGGFTDILQLLMETNIDMTRQTHQGTALHEAALCGKINAVKFLINAGIDVNIPNSYEQTALDIVHKFTRKAGAKELKAVLEEASRAITVKAVKSYSNVNDPQSLTFAAGDLITVIDQKPNGVWRGFVMKDGRKSSDGYFPSNCVAVPDLLSKTSSATEGDLAGSGAIFREPPVAPRPWYSSAILANGDLVSPTLRLAAPLTPDSCNSTNGSYHFPPPSPSYRAPEMAVIPENRISTCSRSSSNSGDHRVSVH
ncbi:CASKIN2 [Bugula neritina]|uniref:CASKIN2 n=1 Tax=Bugula neritina TaxID=10212 RepID=A0A7J7K8V2_BUGNE|nr:CASKIN2 [Bugula neritina]